MFRHSVSYQTGSSAVLAKNQRLRNKTKFSSPPYPISCEARIFPAVARPVPSSLNRDASPRVRARENGVNAFVTDVQAIVALSKVTVNLQMTLSTTLIYWLAVLTDGESEITLLWCESCSPGGYEPNYRGCAFHTIV